MFTAFRIGELELKHRIVMAPLTRCRAPQTIPNELMAEYYSQRTTTGGLLITEGTFPNKQARLSNSIPGIWTSEQASQWKMVVDKVHEKGGIFFCQLWHVGRATNLDPVSCTSKPLSSKGSKVPHALTIEEIEKTVMDFKHAAELCKEAGFDGVEVHSANGYLLNQFLDGTINDRQDKYGGSYENRVRFLLQVIEAVQQVYPKRVGVRLSPYSNFNETGDNDEEFWNFVTSELNKYDLAYLHLVEPRVIGGGQERPTTHTLDSMIAINKLPLIRAGGYNNENFKQYDDCAIAFGRYFISNPTLVDKLKTNEPLTKYDRSTFYTPGAKGYTTYK